MNIISRLKNRFIKEKFLLQFSKYRNISFSQDGDDIIIDNLLEFPAKGFYVDLGAYHPAKFSNTLKFYMRGWNGLNIDATPGSMELFRKKRPRDINVEAAIGKIGGVSLTYYVFDEGALNTFDEVCAKEYIDGGYKLKEKVEVQTFGIMELFDKYIPDGTQIDFLDIDVEGYDKVIVESIDWEKYKPKLVLTESNLDSDNSVADIMIKNGYVKKAATMRNEIWARSNW